jgi:LysM repeat protein
LPLPCGCNVSKSIAKLFFGTILSDNSASLHCKLQFMKKVFVLFALLLTAAVSFAQTAPLLVQLDGTGSPYLNHSIGPKENFYSIGRIYNISPKVYAPYNKIELASALSIGQVLRIPLNEVNFWQSGVRKENEVVVPVYYEIKGKGRLMEIGKMFNTDEASLKSWNNLSSDAVAAGKKIIIGFLKVDKTLSPLAAQGMNVRSEPNIVKQEPKPEAKKEPEVVKKEEPKVTPPVVKKEEPKITPPVVKKEEPKIVTPPVVKKEEPKPEPVKQEPVVVKKEEVKYEPASYSGNGFFKDEFNRQSNNGKQIASNAGSGSIFKSTSGWSDGKYYVLLDKVEKGTIVMIKNPSNGKAIYAKVLGGVEETSPGSGYLFRVSNAAAAQLGISTENFSAELIWGK